MKRINNIVVSNTEPSVNSLWINKNTIKWFSRSGWEGLDFTDNTKLWNALNQEIAKRQKEDEGIKTELTKYLPKSLPIANTALYVNGVISGVSPTSIYSMLTVNGIKLLDENYESRGSDTELFNTNGGTVSINDIISQIGLTGHNRVNSLTSVPVDKKLVIANISRAQTLTLASLPADGREVNIIVHNSGSGTISVSLASMGGNYVIMTDSSLSIDSGGYAEINVISDGTNGYVRAI